jgi:hypothetical protein
VITSAACIQLSRALNNKIDWHNGGFCAHLTTVVTAILVVKSFLSWWSVAVPPTENEHLPREALVFL